MVFVGNRTLGAVLAAMMVLVPGTASAVTLTTTNPYEFGGRLTNWDQNIESESAQVIKSGSHTNFNVDGGATAWGSGTWLFGSYVETTFTVPADTLFIQFQSDANDGIAQFVVDNIVIGSLNTFNRGWFQVAIGELTLGLHTLRVNRLSADLAFDNFGALATATPVPLPAALPLFAGGLGLFGLLGWRRKRRGVA